jgi:hypothetical protein
MMNPQNGASIDESAEIEGDDLLNEAAGGRGTPRDYRQPAP